MPLLRTYPSPRYASYIPSLCWAGLIFWFSAQSGLPSLTTPWAEILLKKTAHFLIFGGLYFWLWWGTLREQWLHQKQTKLQLNHHVMWALLLLTGLYALSDEFHQISTFSRHPSLWDVAIDLCGASSVAYILHHSSRWPTRVQILAKQLLLVK